MKGLLFLLIFICLLLVLAFTNPARDKHVSMLKEIVGIELRKNFNALYNDRNFDEVLNAWIDLLEPQLVYTSYLFWSTSEIKDEGSNKSLGKAIGILNNVIIIYYHDFKGNEIRLIGDNYYKTNVQINL